jgi:hypothetical protein
MAAATSAMGLYQDGSDRRSRGRGAGLILLAVGIGTGLLIGLSGEETIGVAIGVGSIIGLIGLALLINAAMDSQSRPYPPRPPAPPSSTQPGDSR